ncbi:MAG: hypothetical protein ACI4PC_03890 [Oscillospiraceae bacterium]
MVSFEQAGKMLDAAVEELPQGIFRELNGGVNLLPEERMSADGRYTLGLYHSDSMGRYVEIFYGSFAALYGTLPPEKFERKLKKTLHHELTHHVESLAGDRSLEKWDEEQTELWENGGTLYTESVLFVDEDDRSLAPAAAAMFRALAAERCPEVEADSAGLEVSENAPAEEAAVKAAAALGGDIAAHRPRPVDGELVQKFDAVLCMTLEQADELADRYPEEWKIMCLGGSDLRPPRTKMGWSGAMKRIRAEVESLLDELCMEDT